MVYISNMTLDAISTFLQTMAKRFVIVESSASPAEPGQIAEVESLLGVRFQPHYRDFLTTFGGLQVEARDACWPPPDVELALPRWAKIRGLRVYGLGDQLPLELHIVPATQEHFRLVPGPTNGDGEETTPVGTQRGIAPFLQMIGQKDLYCFNEEGEIGVWCYETHSLETIDEDFTELLARELRALRENSLKIASIITEEENSPSHERKALPVQPAETQPPQ
ncbi:MAG: SMI1/KNR4 family protein [Candidatus Methylacidiphilales bacterium]|nr:SMI1/KNR4 family protein [Candidatus Methylacidiphilales bacterium]